MAGMVACWAAEGHEGGAVVRLVGSAVAASGTLLAAAVAAGAVGVWHEEGAVAASGTLLAAAVAAQGAWQLGGIAAALGVGKSSRAFRMSCAIALPLRSGV